MPPWVKGSFTNSHITYNRTIYLYFLDVKFQLFGYLLFPTLTTKKPQRFFGSTPILTHFLVFRGNNSNKQRLTELKFWSQVVLIVVQMPFKAFWRTQILQWQDLAKICVFDPTLNPIYALKISEIKNSHQVIQISQNQGPICFQFPVKTIINFCAIWAFLGRNGFMIKDQVLTA